MNALARALVARPKGILAADEAGPKLDGRFAGAGVATTEENRRRYRELMFTTAGVERHLSGVILHAETLRQHCTDGTGFAQLLTARGIVPGVKVDQGLQALASGETITVGREGLHHRLVAARQLGARFAKWRAAIAANTDQRTQASSIKLNADALARYASACQAAEMMPIVEPEVLMDGAHGLDRSEAVTSEVLARVFDALNVHGVALEAMLLKSHMVLPGLSGPECASPGRIAESTLRCFERRVPAAVPGIVFLSGGQDAIDATERLHAINACGPQPWPLTFCFGRALQAPVLAEWRGQETTVAAAQRVFAVRCALNSRACEGRYASDMAAERALLAT